MKKQSKNIQKCRTASSVRPSLFTAMRRSMVLIATFFLFSTIIMLPHLRVTARECCRRETTRSLSNQQGKRSPFPLVGNLGAGSVYRAVWAPDGRKFATAGNQGVYIHGADPDDQAEISLSPNLIHANDVTFSPDGRFIASADGDGVIRVRYADSGDEFKTLRQKATTLTFSRDGNLFFVGGDENAVSMWRLFANDTTGETILKVARAADIEIDPQGRLIALPTITYEDVEALHILDLKTRAVVDDFEDNVGVFSDIIFSPDGKSVIAYDGFPEPNEIKFWSIGTHQLTKRISVSDMRYANLTMSPDGRFLAVGDVDGKVILMDLEAQPVENRQYVSVFDEVILNMDFNPAGDEILVTGLNNLIAHVFVPSGKVIIPVYDYMGYVEDIELSPDEQWIATASDDGVVRLWNTYTMKAVRQMLQSDWTSAGYVPVGVALSSDGTRLASFGGNKVAKLWDTQTGALIMQLGTSICRSITFEPSGDRIAIVTANGDIEIWDTEYRSTLAMLHIADATAMKALFVADRKLLAAVYDDWSLRIWDLDHKIVTPVLEGVRVGIDATASGNWILASGDHHLILFSIKEQKATTLPLDGNVMALAPGGNRIAVGSHGAVFVLDLASKDEVLELAGTTKGESEDTAIEAVGFGNRFIVAAQGKTVFVWSTASK